MKCKVCSSRHRKEIDIRLLSRSRTGESLKAIAKGYFGISESSIRRHAEKHLHLKEIESDESHSELTLEDMRKAAVDMYSKATMRSDIKGANDSLGHLIRIEELISKEKDRLLEEGKQNIPIEIELHWADDIKGSSKIFNENNDLNNKPNEAKCEWGDSSPDAIPEVKVESPDIEYYKHLAEESKPVKIRRNEAGEITHIETPAGIIPKIPHPDVVDINSEDIPEEEKESEIGVFSGDAISRYTDFNSLPTATPDIKDIRKRVTGRVW